MRQISIEKKMNGYVVNVGCQSLVFESKEKLLVELARYLNDPQGVEKEYVEKFGLADTIGPNVAQTATAARSYRVNTGYAEGCQGTSARFDEPIFNR